MPASRRERLSDILWSLAAVAIVIAGVAGFRLMGAMKTPLEAEEIARAVPTVETRALVPHRDPVPIRGEGFVRPRRQVSVAAESAGRVRELHPALLALGRVEAGEVLVRLDDRAARASLARADADLDATRARISLNAAQLERTETLRRRGVVSQEALDRVLAEEAELAGALASLESARLGAEIALENTRVLAPFDATVLARSVELGGVASPGQALAELLTADELEVTVPLTERAASLVPDLFGAGAGGAAATVTTTFAGRESARPARVTRVARALGSGTRMLDVTVSLDPDFDPEPAPDADQAPPTATPGRALPDATRSAADAADDGEPPLSGPPPALVGGYARVTIDGARLEGLHAVPSSAIRPGGTLWLAVGDTFAVRPARTVHVDGATSYVRIEDLPEGAALVTGVVDTPIEGMRIAPLPADARTGADPGTDAAAVLDAAALDD